MTVQSSLNTKNKENKVMSKIILVKLYEEQDDTKTLKDFEDLKKPHEEADEEQVIHELMLGTNEQTFNRRERNYE